MVKITLSIYQLPERTNIDNKYITTYIIVRQAFFTSFAISLILGTSSLLFGRSGHIFGMSTLVFLVLTLLVQYLRQRVTETIETPGQLVIDGKIVYGDVRLSFKSGETIEIDIENARFVDPNIDAPAYM